MDEPLATLAALSELQTSTAPECSTEERLQLQFQLKLLESAIKIIFASLLDVQERMKKKYFFQSILEFMKFITDEPDK